MLENLKLSDRYDGFLFLAEAARNPPLLKPHHHVELELNLVKRGTITYVVGGERFSFPQGTLLWMFPSQEHQLVDRTDDAQYYVAVFKPDFIRRSCKGELYSGLKRNTLSEGGVLHALLAPEAFDLMRRTLDSLMEGSLDADLLNREAGFGVDSDFRFEHRDPDGLNAGLHHLLLLGWRYQCASRTQGAAVRLHPSVRRALTLLSQEDGEKSLSWIARRCGVSEAYLSRVFARQVGVTLGRYRNSMRLARFWARYRSPEQCTIAEAVYAAGFGSYAQFFKVFRQAYGKGPRDCLRSDGASPCLRV